MPSEEVKKRIYRNSRRHIGLNQREWARLFAVGGLNTFQSVSFKESDGPNARGVNLPEALAAQLLTFLYDQNYDVAAAEFDSEGVLLGIPKFSCDS